MLVGDRRRFAGAVVVGVGRDGDDLMHLERVGIWTFAFDRLPIGAVRDAAAEIEELGYGAIWVGEAAGRESLTHAALLLAETDRLIVASGIARIGDRSPRATHAAANTLAEASDGRFVLGLGGSNQLGTGHSPVDAMATYLDGYGSARYIAPRPAAPVPVVLGAQGPAMLRLARDRTDGSHTYLVTPDHTAWARSVLGAGPMLAVEQAVIVETDATAARAAARGHLAFYLRLPHFQANFARVGFTPDDWDAGGTDRLVDALVAWGDEDTITDRVRAHLDAGADHVCVQPIASGSGVGLETVRRIAPALAGLNAG